MNDIIKKPSELTEHDIVNYCWIETMHEGNVRFIRGRKRTMDEGILLCGGDIKRYLEYTNCQNE